MGSKKFSIKRLLRRRGSKPFSVVGFHQWLSNLFTLATLRKNLWSWTKRFFRFVRPAWVTSLSLIEYKPNKRLTLLDYCNPIYWIRWSYNFMIRWLFTRPVLQLGPALLAVLTAAWLGGLMVRQSWEIRDWRSEQYERLLMRATAEENEELAHVCLVNLISRFPDRGDYRLQQALLQERQGNEAAAMSTMLDLAYDKKSGRAAFWVALKQLDLEEVEGWNEEQHKQFRALMEIAMQDARGQMVLPAQGLYSQYLMRIGAFYEAIRFLEAIAVNNSGANLTIAQLYSKLADTANTYKFAELARQHFSRVLREKPSDKDARIRLSQALVLLEKKEEAAGVFSDGYTLTRDPEFALAGAETMAAWAMQIRETKGDTLESLHDQIRLLTKASTLAPNSEVVLEALVEVAIECADSNSAQIRNLRQTLLAGASPESVHFIEGTVALRQGDIDQANFHFGLANQNSNQRYPGLLNNMAVALAKKDPPELEEALRLVNAALELVEHPYLRETRGQILVKMKRYRESITDLEAGLLAPELTDEIYKSLAIAYRALGQEALAAEYEKQVSEAEGK